MSEIYKNWNFVRVLRLGLALWVAYSGFTGHQPMFIFLGMMLAVQALLNVGCFGSGNCSVQEKPIEKATSTDEVIYEEVK